MTYEEQFKIDILTFLSDNKEHSVTEIIEQVTKNYLKKSFDKKKHYPVDKIRLSVELMVQNLFNYQYIKKSKIHIDNCLITKKGVNYLIKNKIITKEDMDSNSNNAISKSEEKNLKKYLDIKLDGLNLKIDSNSYEIYEMINYIMEDLNKTQDSTNNRITKLENIIDKKFDIPPNEKPYDNFNENKNCDEIVDYLEISNYNNYLTLGDLSKIISNLNINKEKNYTNNFLKKLMITFYQDNNLTPDAFIIEGKSITYFMGVSISDSKIINKLSIELIENWINNNIITTNDKKDRILFDDLIYEIVKSFRLNNINKMYYNNIESLLENCLVSLYESIPNDNLMMKTNDIIICHGLKYKNEINSENFVTKNQKEGSLKTLIYNWLNENLIRTDDSSNKLALTEIYENIYPYLTDNKIFSKKTSITYEIGKVINTIFQGKYKIKREIIDNKTIYIGLKLKNSNSTNDKFKDNSEINQSSNKKPGELIEEWLNERIEIKQHTNKILYLDEITSTFINDLSKKNIIIEDNTGLRSNISRLLRVFYKENTNKKIDTSQDEQLKRYYKNIQIKKI